MVRLAATPPADGVGLVAALACANQVMKYVWKRVDDSLNVGKYNTADTPLTEAARSLALLAHLPARRLVERGRACACACDKTGRVR